MRLACLMIQLYNVQRLDAEEEELSLELSASMWAWVFGWLGMALPLLLEQVLTNFKVI
jgi:hypothetical protein